MCLVPENVAKVVWWTHSSFDDEAAREAAELIAFEPLNPSLRSRGRPTDRARVKQASKEFHREMENLFRSLPAGEFRPLTLENLADLVMSLEKQIADMKNHAG